MFASSACSRADSGRRSSTRSQSGRSRLPRVWPCLTVGRRSHATSVPRSAGFFVSRETATLMADGMLTALSSRGRFAGPARISFL